MDAPKGRHRVEEKDGRLVVIDNATGSSLSPPAPPAPPAPGAARPSPVRPRGRSEGPPNLLDALGRLLLHLVVDHWDEQGRAVVAWAWEENGRARRWDAALDPGRQRRLGRALLAFAAFPTVILLSVFGSFGLLWLLILVLPASLWGVWSVVRLQRETGARDE
ncbi:MAG TPA: hypothetical protein VF650_04685 [Allosphingosinicella sp.]|jgi:hypothetical protein